MWHHDWHHASIEQRHAAGAICRSFDGDPLIGDGGHRGWYQWGADCLDEREREAAWKWVAETLGSAEGPGYLRGEASLIVAGCVGFLLSNARPVRVRVAA